MARFDGRNIVTDRTKLLFTPLEMQIVLKAITLCGWLYLFRIINFFPRSTISVALCAIGLRIAMGCDVENYLCCHLEVELPYYRRRYSLQLSAFSTRICLGPSAIQQ